MVATDPAASAVERHYLRPGLLGAIETGLLQAGKAIGDVSIDDLAAVDEFHIGGRDATIALLDQLGLDAADHLLDVGCGLGGPARLAATRFGCRVTGIDLTRDYVEAGQTLCGWVGLGHRVSLHHASALAMPFPDATFDAACLLHVGMNIAAKEKLFAEIARVVRPGSRVAIYDVMRLAEGDLAYPLPWSDTGETSALATLAAYREVAEAAGFRVLAERNRREFAISYFEEQRRKAAAGALAPPLGLHTLMGDRRAVQIRNMRVNLISGLIAPTELVLEKC